MSVNCTCPNGSPILIESSIIDCQYTAIVDAPWFGSGIIILKIAIFYNHAGSSKSVWIIYADTTEIGSTVDE